MKIPVVITTDETKRGVFMGIIDEKDINNENIIAEEVRMAVKWSPEVHGVIGLSAKGPTKNCRITPAVKKSLIKGVTLVAEMTEEALKNWRKEPWG